MIEKEEYQRRVDIRFPFEKFLVIDYNGLGHNAKIQCLNCNQIIEVSKASNFLVYSKKYGCKNCNSAFFKNSQKELDDIQKKYNIINIQHKENDSHLQYTIRCKKCGHIRMSSLSNISRNLECGCQTGVLRLRTPEEFIQMVNNSMHDTYSLVGEYKNQTTKVLLKHEKCGFIYKVRPADVIQGHSTCPKCRKTDSVHAQYITNLLYNYDIKFEKEKVLNNSKLRFDFYFENDFYKFAIEYNGIQHYKQVEYFTSTLDEIQDRDNRKKQYCLDNGIELFIIPYTFTYDEIKKCIIKIINKFNDYPEMEQI